MGSKWITPLTERLGMAQQGIFANLTRASQDDNRMVVDGRNNSISHRS